MSKTILFSDSHFNNYRAYSHITENGLNSRMLIGINILEQIKEYAIENGIEIIIFCGDLLEKGSSIQPDLLETLLIELDNWKENGLKLIGIPGQHDYYAMNGIYNAIAPLFDYIDIMENGDFQRNGDIAIQACWHTNTKEKQLSYLSYVKEREFTKTKYNLFIGHFLVKELLEKNNAPFDADCVSFEDLPGGFDLYALGDYHHHVWIPEKKLLSVGVTHQHSWKEKNCKGSFCVYDFETQKLERIYTKAPEFIEVGVNDIEKLSTDNFYEVVLKDREEEKRLVDIPAHIKFTVSHDYAEEDNPTEERIEDLHFNMDKKQVMMKYLAYMDKMGDQELIQIGKEYLGLSGEK